MTERPALDAWLADTEWVTSNDPLSDDAVRCRPEPSTPADAFAQTCAPIVQAMQQLAALFEDAMRGIAAAWVNVTVSFDEMAEQWKRDRVAEEREQQRVRYELEHLYARSAPPGPLDIRNLPNLPLHADSCPRHGPTRGGTCWRCRR